MSITIILPVPLKDKWLKIDGGHLTNSRHGVNVNEIAVTTRLRGSPHGFTRNQQNVHGNRIAIIKLVSST
jgi:hypothetical protein